MVYVPNNQDVYNAAFSGALAGISGSGRIPNPSVATAGNFALIAGAFAQQFDTSYAGGTICSLELELILALTEAEFSNRTASGSPLSHLINPTTYAAQCIGLNNIIDAAVAYYIANGLNDCGACGIKQIGYDQGQKNVDLVITSEGPLQFPRDITPNPIQVVLPGVKFGNMLEIFWVVNAVNETQESGIATNFNAIAIVAFTDVPIYPTDYFLVDLAQGGNTIGDGELGSTSASAAVPIPEGANAATVQLLYQLDNQDLFVAGTDDFIVGNVGTSSFLKAQEVCIGSVPQTGPGNASISIAGP